MSLPEVHRNIDRERTMRMTTRWKRAARRIGAVLAVGVTAAAAGQMTAGAALAFGEIGYAAGDRAADFVAWDSADEFAEGEFAGVEVGEGGSLELADTGTTTRDYADPFVEDAPTRQYTAGTWTSPVTGIDFEATEAVASWNALTETGTWVEVEFRGRHDDGSWTKWYTMARWTSGLDFAGGDIHRTTVDGQGDDDGTVYTDTFVAEDGRELTGDQIRVTLLRPVEGDADVSVSLAGVMASKVDGDLTTTSTTTMTEDTVLDVPQYSQMIHVGEYPEYGGGGEVWCSPTSSSMVLSYWGEEVPAEDLAAIETNEGDPQVPWAAMHTFDFAYDGAGNWPFNTAYSASFGLSGFVTRLKDLTDVEKLVKAGIPVVISLAFSTEELPEAGYDTNGHLLVIVGFESDGDVVVNDPAAPTNDDVRRVYTRANLENVWANHSGGIAYLVHPDDVPLPVAKNLEAPTVVGEPQVGATLSVSPGSWTVEPAAFSYQWQLDGSPVEGATAATYTVPEEALGRELSVLVTPDDADLITDGGPSLAEAGEVVAAPKPTATTPTTPTTPAPAASATAGEPPTAAPGETPGRDLAFTGGSGAGWIGAFAAAIVLISGAALVVASRRRRI